VKFYYLNDRTIDARVYIKDMFNTPVILKPAQGQTFEVPVPKGWQIFVKVWETNVVLLSYIKEGPA